MYVMTFEVTSMQQISGFLYIIWFPPPIKLAAMM